jgi:hypothetical protein
MPQLNKKAFRVLFVATSILGKVSHLGNVDFRVEGQSAIHGTVALHAKWPALATMPSLAKLHCKHHNYCAGVIAGCAGVVTFVTSYAASIALAS